MSTDASGALAHHFDNMEQQQGAARLGMWMFLVTEVLFFGGIFVRTRPTASGIRKRSWPPAAN